MFFQKQWWLLATGSLLEVSEALLFAARLGLLSNQLGVRELLSRRSKSFAKITTVGTSLADCNDKSKQRCE